MTLTSLHPSQEELILGFLAEGGDDFISGEALSSKLGMAPTDVWKHVESLRHKGYRIDALSARGYRLVEIPDRLSSLEISPLLSTHDLGQTLHSYEVLPSTHTHALQLAEEGAEHGEVVIAEAQTAGKGRRGRTWNSPAHLNLYFSAVLRPELPVERAPELTLVASVALAETLREAGTDALIKWPNDVEVGGRKVAGVLTELSADAQKVQFVILSMGINLNARFSDFPPELQESATSLAEARGQRVPRALFTAALLTRLETWMDTHQEEGFEPVRARWKKLSSTLGKDVLVRTETSELRGVAEDIDESGALWVLTPEGVRQRVLTGDVEQLRSRKR